MRLTVDLRFNGPTADAADDERVVTLNDLAQAARHPRDLRHLIRDTAVDEVRLLRDEQALNGVQSGGAFLASLTRADRFEVGPPSARQMRGRTAARAHAAADLAAALPAEFARGTLLYRRARQMAATQFSLPKRPQREVRRVTYLRGEPSLRWLGAQVGGAAAHTAGVINGLSDNEVDVTVFAPEVPDGLRGAECQIVRAQHLILLAQWLTLVGYSDQLVAASEHVPADLVYQRYALGSFAGLELARRLGVPLVLEFNASEIWVERHWGRGRLPLINTLSALERRNLEDASLIVIVSSALKRQLEDEGIHPARLLVNPNGVDVRGLAEVRAHPPDFWRSRLRLAPAPTIGFVGTFGLWHGVLLLPELIERVSELEPEARWVLVGDGPLHGEVAAEIERRGLVDRVELTGIVPRERAIQLLAACDVCVSPHVPNPDGTPFFGSPTKLFEYMGLGKAIVASDLDQIGEVLTDGRTALLTQPSDVPVAAAAVKRLLDDEALRKRLGEAALREATEHYTWEAHVQRILDAVGDGPAERGFQ